MCLWLPTFFFTKKYKVLCTKELITFMNRAKKSALFFFILLVCYKIYSLSYPQVVYDDLPLLRDMESNLIFFKSDVFEGQSLEKKTQNINQGANKPDPITIIIAYRDRLAHYHKFMKHISAHPQRGRMKIIVVEQDDTDLFRRGWLFNIGILESGAKYTSCIVTHDVDIFVSYTADYGNCVMPTIPCSSLNEKMWPSQAGGVLTATGEDWKRVNGYTNLVYGWGGEDDELFGRFLQNSLVSNLKAKSVRRPTSEHESCFSLNDQDHTTRLKPNYEKIQKQYYRVLHGSKEWKEDGLNSIRYTITSRFVDEYGTLWLKANDNRDVRYNNMFDTRYINLKSRPDRRKSIENEFHKNHIFNAKRIEAEVPSQISDEQQRGGLGCSLSHIKALRSTENPVVLIAEDDAQILRTPPLIELETPSFLWHVLLFAYKGKIDYKDCVTAHKNKWCRVLNAQTASMYAVRQNYIPHLLHTWNRSVNGLLFGNSYHEFAGDQTWKKLQKQKDHHWYAAVPRISKQKKGFSNITGRNENYGV